MSDKRNVPAGGGTPTGTGQENDLAGVFPCLDCTTPPVQRQVPKVRVADFLSAGEQNGQTLKQLREILPGDGRSLRAQIERERRDTPILSGQSGYYLPACEDEIRRFCGSMRRRARAIWTSAANVEKAAGLSKCNPQLEGQIAIGGGETNG